MTDRKASRREFFRLFAGGAAGEEARRRPAAPRRASVAVPVERGRAVVDISIHPLPRGMDLLVTAEGAPGSILVARPSSDHYAAVAGDCPRCGDALRYDPLRDVVACPGRDGAWRLDGLPQEGPRDLRIASFIVRRAGPRVEIEIVAPPDV